MFPLYTKLLLQFHLTELPPPPPMLCPPGCLGRHLPEQGKSRCQENVGTGLLLLQGISSLPWTAAVLVHSHLKRSSLKNTASCNREIPCQKTSGPHTWRRVCGWHVTSPCGPRASPGRQMGTETCCMSQQHYGDHFRCPSFTSEKGNKRLGRSRRNPSGLRGSTDSAHSLCFSHLLCGDR